MARRKFFFSTLNLELCNISPALFSGIERVVSSSFVPPAPFAETGQPADIWIILKTVAETAVLFGFFLSVIGWSYLGSYYAFFAFRPMELDISSPVVMVFAVSALSRSSLLLAAVAIVILVLRFFRVNLPHIEGFGLLLVLIIATLASYELGSFFGRHTARQDIWNTSSRLPSAGIFLRSARVGYPSCVSVTSPTIDCRLLLHIKGNYYLIKPFTQDVEGAETVVEANRNLEVYAVPDSQVLLVQYERGVK